MEKELQLRHKKSTKYTEVYENEDWHITFYIPKTVLEGKAPAEVYITISDKKRQ